MRAFDEASRRCAREIEAWDFDLLFATALSITAPLYYAPREGEKVLYLQEPCRSCTRLGRFFLGGGASENLEQAISSSPAVHGNYPNCRLFVSRPKHEWLNAQACDRLLVNSYFSRESVLRAMDGREGLLPGSRYDLFRYLRLEREHFIVGVGSLIQSRESIWLSKAVAAAP